MNRQYSGPSQVNSTFAIFPCLLTVAHSRYSSCFFLSSACWNIFSGSSPKSISTLFGKLGQLMGAGVPETSSFEAL